MRNLDFEIEQSIHDVKEGVKIIKVLDTKTVQIITKEDLELIIEYTDQGYCLNGESFETLHNLLLEKSLAYKTNFQDSLFSKLSKIKEKD